MKKIGIMTWFDNNNYGSVLQATALEHIIEKMKYEALIINYKTKSYDRSIKNIYPLFKRVLNRILNPKYKNDEIFNKFKNNNLKITQAFDTYMELKQLNNLFDAFICGSDQIWSPLSFDEKFFLNFAENNKKISYAPSFGVNSVKNKTIKDRMQKLISEFNYISVRELKGKEIVNELTGKEAQLVLDPTLLLNMEEWEFLSEESNDNTIFEGYILCYFLGKSNKYYKDIVNFAKKEKLRIINIPVLKNQRLNKYNQNGIGPIEFVSLIKKAKYVFTDSYHGTIFSINFNRQFITFKRFKDDDKKSENSRLESIFNIFKLNKCFISKLNTELVPRINYDCVNKILYEYRNKSIQFLQNSIENVNEIKLSEKKNYITEYCTGCGACKNVCPNNAIEIKLNSEGFQHCYINLKKCINCGLCKKICPMMQLKYKSINSMVNLYSFKSMDSTVLLKSSSGGFAYAVSNYLNNNYYICGCYYDKKARGAKHIIIKPNNNQELYKLQGSKYIQSKTDNVFEQLMKLPENAKVVFFGTPCQVAGLDSLLTLNKKRSNYILIELICHGVPSKFLWDNYLKNIGKKYGFKNMNNISVIFRDKKYGWQNKMMTIYDDNKKVSIKEGKDDFYALFNRRCVNNNACYECPYRKNSYADIKIGDFWGEKFIKDKTGMSMIITMTEKR